MVQVWALVRTVDRLLVLDPVWVSDLVQVSDLVVDMALVLVRLAAPSSLSQLHPMEDAVFKKISSITIIS